MVPQVTVSGSLNMVVSLDIPNIELFESRKKQGMASSWLSPRHSNQKSTTFSKTGQVFIIEILQFLKLYVFTTV